MEKCKEEAVNHPAHYNTKNPVIYIPENTHERCIPIECIDVIRNMPTWKGNAIKYLWRAGLKLNGSLDPIAREIEDLNKAIWYIKDRISALEKDLLDDSEV